MAEPHLYAVPGGAVVDGNGELDDDALILPGDVANLFNRNKRLEREIAALKAQITKLRAVDPDAETIGDILVYWKQECGHPRAQIPLDGKRAESVKAMLKLYPPETLRLAIDVVARVPWMGDYGQRYCEPGPGRKRKDDPTIIFRNEVTVERILRIALDEHVAADHGVYRAWLHEQCQCKPGLVKALAFLAERPPHGAVIAAAAVWAKTQQAGVGL